MTETTTPVRAHASEQEARAIAEASREAAWTAPSFVRELFLGRLGLELIHPYPEPDPDEQRRAAPFLDQLERFLRAEVDAERIEHEARIPDEVVAGLKRLGAFGIKIPREYGGLGLSQYTYGRAMAMCGTVSSALVTLLSAHQSIGVPQPLKLFGTEEQKNKWLPRLAAGAISAFALTEPDVGSDPARMTTTATPTPDGSGFVIDGEKLWCTNGTMAELMVVMARTPGKPGRPGPISAFIVEGDTPGIEVMGRLEFMGLRGIENAWLRFKGVRVPKENLLAGEGRGLKLALVTLNTGRLTVPAGCAAAGKWCLQVAREFAAQRVQWGRPVGQHEAVAQMLTEIAAGTYAMESVADLCSLLADRGRSDVRLEAAIAKLWNTEKAWELCDLAVQVCGGRGYETARSLGSRGETPVPLERLLRDLRINRIFEGTSQIMRLFIAREALDVHLTVAGDAVMPGVPAGRRLAGLARAGAFYARWYPSRWLGAEGARYGEFGPLADHVRWVARTARRLARAQFHLMVRHGPGLEKRQAQLFRCVDVGAELFAMAATCARAQRDRAARATDGSSVELADVFCRLARRRVERLFQAIASNDDPRVYEVARDTLDRRYAWLEDGIIGLEVFAAAETRGAAEA
ncbi:MAG TPA: acyl-CoA dehydrogenase family protein [Candidatus Eisenbacteria bacterium]|nr:acyl-CoA dehydrogenase family protein [Candidatus Eisenbacteria bacterium]